MINEIEMRHFVHYHNSNDMGYSVSSIPTPRLFTNKSVKNLPENTVWLISGEGKKSPKSFYLAAAFKVTSIDDKHEHPKFKYSAHGVGSIFGETISLDGELWFDFFKKEQSNFRYGLTEITGNSVIKHFQKISGYTF